MKPIHALFGVPFLGILALNLVERQRHQAEMGQIQRELASLHTSVDDARQGASAEVRAPVLAALRPAAPAPVAREDAPAEEPPAAEAEPPVPPPAPEVTEVRQQLEHRFVDERVDPAWRANAQRTIQDKLAQVLPETSSLRSVECRASMCRFETVHVGLESYRQFVHDAFMNPRTKVWNGGFFSTPLTDPVDGKLQIISYLARDGEELAPVQPLQ